MRKLLFVLMLVSVPAAHAQYAVGGDIGYKVFTDGKMSSPAIGLSFINHNDDGDLMFYSGVGFGFPKTYTNTLAANPIDPYMYSATTVNFTSKYTNLYFDLGMGKIFNGDYDDGGFLGYAGLTSILSFHKLTAGTYDRSTHYVDEMAYYKLKESEGINFAYGVKLGLGYLLRFGSLGLTPYADVSLPLLKPSDTEISTYISFGVRLNFFVD